VDGYQYWLILIPIALVGIYLFLKRMARFEHVGSLNVFFEKVPNQDNNESHSYNNEAVELLTPDDSGQVSSEKLEEAIALFDKAVELNQENATAYLNKGLALYYLKQKEAAKHAISKALEIDLKNLQAYNLKGMICFDLGEYEMAISAYDAAIELDPKDVSAYINKANTYDYLGWHEEALVLYDKAISIDPSDGGIYLNKGSALSNLKRKDEARIAFRTANDLMETGDRGPDLTS
jgi:tetratricopeptide (TPR) repeat protein